MKKSFLTILLGLSVAASAQNVWEKPVVETDTPKEEVKTEEAPKVLKDQKYLAGAVPEVDGKVEWTLEVDIPGKDAQQIYDAMLKYMMALTKESNQLPGSQVSLVNKQHHIIVTSVNEWLVFAKKLLIMDRTKFRYTLITTCTDGHVQVIMKHITYKYEEDRDPKNSFIRAEEWITDKYAMNKKGTRLYPVTAKFRRKTIDRKDYLFENIMETLKIEN